MTTAAIYTRISQDREGEALGVGRQLKDCEDLAARLGYTVTRVYTDNDRGASTRSRKSRPEYAAMLADARAGRFSAVLAYSNSRLTRRPRELEDLIELHERYHIRLHTVVSGDDNLATADGRMVIRLKGSIDAAEAERLGERVARKARATREAGGWTGGPRPFGYEADGMTVREAEAVAAREGYRLLLAGASIASIARMWNQAGLHTGRSAQPWTTAGVREALRNPRNAGLRAYKSQRMKQREIIGKAAWPAIVDEGVWLAACQILDAPGRRHRPHSGQRLLTGAAVCGVCGGPVHGSGGSAETPVYRCATSNGHFVRRGAAIDEFVSEVMIERLSRPDAAGLLTATGEDTGSLHLERAAVNARLEQLAVEFADGALTPAQLRAATGRLRDRLGQIDDQLAGAARLNVLRPLVAGDAGEVWGALGTDLQRAVVVLLAEVVILPAGRGRKGFDPDTVQITWKTTADV